MSYSLHVTDFPHTWWEGEPITDKRIFLNLKIGDVVRLILISSSGCGKYYFEITQIDKMGIFHGKAIEVYMEFCMDLPLINEGDIITFKKENIIEIPDWTIDYLNRDSSSGESSSGESKCNTSGDQIFE